MYWALTLLVEVIQVSYCIKAVRRWKVSSQNFQTISVSPGGLIAKESDLLNLPDRIFIQVIIGLSENILR